MIRKSERMMPFMAVYAWHRELLKIPYNSRTQSMMTRERSERENTELPLRASQFLQIVLPKLKPKEQAKEP